MDTMQSWEELKAKKPFQHSQVEMRGTTGFYFYIHYNERKKKMDEQQTTEQAQEPNINTQETQTKEAFPEEVKQAYQSQEENAQNNQNQMGGDFSGCDGEFLGLEQFQNGFIQAFSAAGDFTGLKSFPIKEYEIQGANKTAEKLYQMAVKYPALNFLISRKSYWLYDVSLIVGFISMKTNDVVEEKFSVSLKTKIFGWFKWGKQEKTGNASGFLGRLVAGRQQRAEN